MYGSSWSRYPGLPNPQLKIRPACCFGAYNGKDSGGAHNADVSVGFFVCFIIRFLPIVG